MTKQCRIAVVALLAFIQPVLMLASNIAESAVVKLVERTQIERAIRNLEIESSNLFDPDQAVKIGHWVGATQVVMGSLTAVGQRLRIDVRVVDLSSGEVSTTAKVEGVRDGIFDLINSVSTKILAGLSGEKRQFKKLPSVIFNLSALGRSSKDAAHSLQMSVTRFSRCSNSSLNRFNEASNRIPSSFGCAIFAPVHFRFGSGAGLVAGIIVGIVILTRKEELLVEAVRALPPEAAEKVMSWAKRACRSREGEAGGVIRRVGRRGRQTRGPRLCATSRSGRRAKGLRFAWPGTDHRWSRRVASRS
jgi:TolB-like protein